MSDSENNSEIWEVSAIIGRRRDAENQKIQYLVRWKGRVLNFTHN